MISAPLVLETRYFPAGQHCEDAQPGDLILVKSPGLFGTLIRWAERIRCPKGLSRGTWDGFCGWNHAMIAIDDNFVSQEAGKGDVFTPLSTYVAIDYVVLHLAMPSTERTNVVAFARSILGTGYGFFTLPADLFNAVTGVEVAFGWGNRMVCSTASCRALERAGLIPERSPYAVTPAHLAWYFLTPVAA